MGGGNRDLKIEAIRGGDRDLKIDAATMIGGLKKEAVASEAADDRDLNSWKEAIRPAEGEMLRLRKEVKAAWDHWFLTCRKLSNVKKEKAQQAPGAGKKKRKKVVRFKVRREYVEQNRACPLSILADYSDEELAWRTPLWLKMYAAGKFLESKHQEYWNALIVQQDKFGYAEDEKEVTDDDEVVKTEELAQEAKGFYNL